MLTPMANNSIDPSADEVARIRRAYALRTDPSPYSQFDPAHLFACQQRESAILAALDRHGYRSLDHTKILEVGCGTGFWLQKFVRWGARPENIFGVDLLPGRIDEAKSSCPAGIKLTCGNAARLESSSGAFDIVFQSTVFSSVLDENMKKRMASEMLRVLRSGGIIIWYDFTVNNPRNADVRGVSRREARRLFPDCRFEFQRLTLAPPIGRAIARISPGLYRMLQSIRILNTHCLAIIKKKC